MTIADAAYTNWIRRHDWSAPRDLELARQFARNLEQAPRIDVVMPVCDPPESFLREAIDSVRGQIYENWSLCIADDGSKEPHVRKILDAAAEADSRIRVTRSSSNGGIARATNSAIGIGDGSLVAFLDHDDVIPAHALLLVAHHLERSEAGIIYSDFDFFDERGRRSNPFFKPDYNYEFHLGLNFVTHLTVYRRSLLDALGGLREGFPGSEDYDLGLRAVELIGEHRIAHVPHVLYHWRVTESSLSRRRIEMAIESARSAVREHCGRLGVAADVAGTPRSLIWNRVRKALPSPPPAVTLSIQRSSTDDAGASGRSVADATDYSGVTIFKAMGVQGTPGARRNRLVAEATTELVAFVDDRLVPRNRDWLVETASHFVDPACAVVGARTIGVDACIEQCGLLLGVREADGIGPPARAFQGLPETAPSYFGRDEIAQRATAVSGGVFVVRKSAVALAGWFDETFDDPFDIDVDFCLRIRQRGLRVIFDPHAVFAAVAPPLPRRTAPFLRRKWGAELDREPFYNPNLTDSSTDFGLASPPRVEFPWRHASKP